MKKTLVVAGFAGLLMLAGVRVEALSLSPADTTCTSNSVSALKVDEVYDLITSPAPCFGASVGIPEDDFSLLYKANKGGTEDGSYALNYGTSFFNTDSQPSDATITYQGGEKIICAECYLLVKDGNNQPAQYVFRLTNWNGTDAIYLTGFWPGSNPGSISHVAIYGVPEPATILLLASGLAFVTFRKRQQLLG